MKIKKFNENVHSDYVKYLQDSIKKDNKNINGFEFWYDAMSGTIQFDSDYFSILATPYWEDNLNVPINIFNNNGEEILDTKYELQELKSQLDINKVLIYYYDVLNRLTLTLNKISELRDIIPTILNNIPYIEINSNVRGILKNKIYSYNDIIFGSLYEQSNIYDIIYDKYTEYFTAKKFNI